MLVSEIMTQPAETVRASATVAEAAELMALYDVGSLPAREEDRIVGIVTDRDVVLRCIAPGLVPSATLVRTIMTRSPVTLPPSVPVDDAVWLFAHLHIRRLPIVEDGRVVGMLSADDVARYFDDGASIVLMARCLVPAVGRKRARRRAKRRLPSTGAHNWKETMGAAMIDPKLEPNARGAGSNRLRPIVGIGPPHVATGGRTAAGRAR